MKNSKMYIVLNSKQAEGLANFFFDTVKGLIFSAIGFAAFVPFKVRLTVGFLNIIIAFGCVKFAILLLEGVK